MSFDGRRNYIGPHSCGVWLDVSGLRFLSHGAHASTLNAFPVLYCFSSVCIPLASLLFFHLFWPRSPFPCSTFPLCLPFCQIPPVYQCFVLSCLVRLFLPRPIFLPHPCLTLPTFFVSSFNNNTPHVFIAFTAFIFPFLILFLTYFPRHPLPRPVLTFF